MASGSAFMTADEYKKQKAVEEAQKAGKLPPSKDEEGKEINPHVPNFITKAPCNIYIYIYIYE